MLSTNASSARTAGSLNLDKNFEDHIMRTVLEDKEMISLKKSPLYADTLKQFDQRIKPFFTGSSDTKPSIIQLKGVKLTDNPEANLRNNTITLEKYGSESRS